MVLEAIYEQDFADCSYGFRPGRSLHQALDALWQNVMREIGGGLDSGRGHSEVFSTRWITLICGPCAAQRVKDGVLLRLIGKWLNAGVLEDGEISYPDQGAPQGGVVSPLMANVYLRPMLDVGSMRGT